MKPVPRGPVVVGLELVADGFGPTARATDAELVTKCHGREKKVSCEVEEEVCERVSS